MPFLIVVDTKLGGVERAGVRDHRGTFAIINPNGLGEKNCCYEAIRLFLFLQKLLGREAGFLFKIGIEYRFGVEPAFIGHANKREMVFFWVFGHFLKSLYAIVIDKLIEVFSHVFVEQPGELVGMNVNLCRQRPKG